MNNTPQNNSACTGKEAFSRQEANAASRRMNANRYNKKDRAPVKTYKCQVCGQWHLGNPNRKVRK